MFISDIMIIYPRKKGKCGGEKADLDFEQSGRKGETRASKKHFLESTHLPCCRITADSNISLAIHITQTNTEPRNLINMGLLCLS